MSHILHANYGGQNPNSTNQKIKISIKTDIYSVIKENISSWTNKDNFSFYEGVALGDLQRFAVQGGLDTCCDIELIKPLILKKQKILEVGAGYGRVLEYLVKNNFKGELFALERGIKFYHILNEKFQDTVKIFHCDLNDFSTREKFDVILWMWSGISDFSQEEQFLALTTLSNFLKPEGLIIIDTLLADKKLANEIYSYKQYYAILTKYGIAYGYKPTIVEIEKHAERLNFHVKHFLEYETSKSHKRNLHILSKINLS